MFLVRLAKHSIEAVIAVFIIWVGCIILAPTAKSVDQVFAEDNESSTRNLHILRPALRFSRAIIRARRLK